MSLFQCQQCGCVENTALSGQGMSWTDLFNWEGIEERRGLKLCSACGPAVYKDNRPTKFGKWHGRFPRAYLPMGMFRTALDGNLEHIETGEKDYRKYIVAEEGSDANNNEINKESSNG